MAITRRQFWSRFAGVAAAVLCVPAVGLADGPPTGPGTIYVIWRRNSRDPWWRIGPYHRRQAAEHAVRNYRRNGFQAMVVG